MTIRTKIFTAGAIIFVFLVIVASMNIAMHVKVRRNLELRDEVNQRLATIEEHANWANNLNLMIADIVASGHVPDFSSEILEPPVDIEEEESSSLVEHARKLIDLVKEKENKTEEAEYRFEALRTTINNLYYQLDKRIATVLAIAQMDRVLGKEGSQETSPAPYVLKSLNQLTLIAMNNLLCRDYSPTAMDAVEHNRRFLATQLQALDEDGSMTSLFDALLVQIDSMEYLFPEVERTIGHLDTQIQTTKGHFDKALASSKIHSAITKTTSEGKAANISLENASRRTLIISILFLIGAPILVIATGLLGLNRLVVRPITNLVAAMKGVEQGDFDIKAPVQAPDELGQLAQAFNAMASQIKAKVDDLARLNQTLEESQGQLKAVLESNANPIVVYDTEFCPQYLNPAFTEVFGWTLEQLAGSQIPFVPDNEKELATSKVSEVYATGRPVRFSSRRLTSNNKTLDVLISAALIRGSEGKGIVESLTDISEQKHLENQLRQAQKMEAIGQLAGGVAHDFNNILTAMFANVEMALRKTDTQPPDTERLRENLHQLKQCTQRAASLTRQLLAFSRRQVIRPESLNVNSTLHDLEKMLHRLITEDIALELRCAPDLQQVKVDPGQLEQVVMNLVVNARDAMKDGGKLTLETQNVVLDEGYAATHPDANIGPHVMLAVSDTGCGMDQATLKRVFEPFFTTKPMGQGTGLGLSTVYGIMKQSEGSVSVYSEPGQGTTFKIYLPVVQEAATHRDRLQIDGPPPGGCETIIICEDDDAVRKPTALMLKEAGYNVLVANTPGSALNMAATQDGHIDLLVTDVIMPEMNGRKLSEALLELRPDVRTLFVSGYTANVIAHHGVLDENVEFLEKPYSQRQLLERIRQVLDSPAPAHISP